MIEGTLKTLTRLQKFVVGFIVSAGSVMTIMNSPNFAAAFPIILLLWLSVIMVMWVNQRYQEVLREAAASRVEVAAARGAEARCQKELHARDKLLAVLWYKLQQRSGGSRPPPPDLEKIVGPEVAQAVRDAAALVNLDQPTMEIKI